MSIARRPLALHAAVPAASPTFPDLTAGELPHRFRCPAADAEAADRQDAVRDLDRGDALLPQRHLPARDRVRRRTRAARRGDRRPSPGPRRDAGARPAPTACRASSFRARPSASCRSWSTTRRRDGRRSSCRRPRSASRSARVVLTSKLIDGTFPDYQRVIPTGNDKRLIVDRRASPRAVDRVSTISSERGRAVKLSLADGQADAVGQQSGFRQRHRGDSRSTTTRRPDRYRLQRPLPARHRGAARAATPRCSCWPIPARRR